jgi:hypothetical protein
MLRKATENIGQDESNIKQKKGCVEGINKMQILIGSVSWYGDDKNTASMKKADY